MTTPPALTLEDRRRFAAYLIHEANQDAAMTTQIESLGPAHQPMVKKRRAIEAAFRIVAQRLTDIEEQTVRGKP